MTKPRITSTFPVSAEAQQMRDVLSQMRRLALAQGGHDSNMVLIGIAIVEQLKEIDKTLLSILEEMPRGR